MESTKNSKSIHVSHNYHAFYANSRVWSHLSWDTVYSLKTSLIKKFVKNGQKHIKLYNRLFFHKTNKELQRKPGWNVLDLRGYDVTYTELKTL